MTVLERSYDGGPSEAKRPPLIRDVTRRSLPPALFAGVLLALGRLGGQSWPPLRPWY